MELEHLNKITKKYSYKAYHEGVTTIEYARHSISIGFPIFIIAVGLLRMAQSTINIFSGISLICGIVLLILRFTESENFKSLKLETQKFKLHKEGIEVFDFSNHKTQIKAEQIEGFEIIEYTNQETGYALKLVRTDSDQEYILMKTDKDEEEVEFAFQQIANYAAEIWNEDADS